MDTRLWYVAGWLAAVVVATAVGFAAVEVVTADVAPVGVSRAAQTDDSEPVVTASSAVPGKKRDRDRPSPGSTERGKSSGGRSGSGSGSSRDDGSSAGAERPLRTQVSDGGTVSARCTVDEDARLISWSPRTGWSVLSADPGPSPVARVSFTDGSVVVTVEASCLGLEPLFGVDVVAVEPTNDPGPTEEPSTAEPSTLG